MVIRVATGYFFNVAGIVWALMDKFICRYLCEGGCTRTQNNQCTLLLLFVAIIFVVVGYALVYMRPIERKKAVKKIKKRLFGK
jgi:ammonia channel protein AmtB